MSVRIRLRRMGAKKQPFYRVVVADSRSPRDGRFLDTIGTYNPRTEPAAIDIDREKTMKWLEEGALPTDSARALLSRAGIWQEFKTGAPAEAGAAAEAPPAAQAPAPIPAPSAPAPNPAPSGGPAELPAEGGMDAPVEGGEESNTTE
jgi:small subunit ribosomal protein S16